MIFVWIYVLETQSQNKNKNKGKRLAWDHAVFSKQSSYEYTKIIIKLSIPYGQSINYLSVCLTILFSQTIIASIFKPEIVLAFGQKPRYLVLT